jgi:hypothetical protein
MLCYVVLISVINFLKITFRIVLFVGDKFTNMLPENMLILGKNQTMSCFWGKNSKYPDFGEKTGNYSDFKKRILACEKGISGKSPKFEIVNQSI